jgi:hypothetical protein
VDYILKPDIINNSILEELMAYFPLIRQGAHRKPKNSRIHRQQSELVSQKIKGNTETNGQTSIRRGREIEKDKYTARGSHKRLIIFFKTKE